MNKLCHVKDVWADSIVMPNNIMRTHDVCAIDCFAW